MSFLPSIPAPADLMHVFKAYPDFSRRLLVFNEAVLRGPGSLSHKHRELLFAYGSALNGCSYCSGIHTEIAAILGANTDVIQRLTDNPDAEVDEPALKSILGFVKKLTLEPANITASDVQALLDDGWDERAVFDAISVCALNNYMNRLVNGLGLQALGEDYNKEVAGMLAKNGYDSQI